VKGQPLTLRQARHHLQIYWFLLPCAIFIGTFMYYPVVNGIYHSFFTWNGGDVERPVGMQNYARLISEDPAFWKAFINAFILGCANIIKMGPSILAAVCLHRVRSEKMQFFYRVGFVMPMIISQMVVLLLWKAFYEPTSGVLNTILNGSGAMNVLVHLSGVAQSISHRFDIFGLFTWLGNLFVAGQNPAWLGGPKFTYIAVILWGFPWVGSFGVLMYLACLQAIGKEIYEAAEVDGAGWFTKFRHIELPMILRQVRIMMVLVIMGSINDAGTIMVLCGMGGGPGGVVDVPALFMFREAFQAQRMGYACGIGVVLFLIILVMTKLNERLVKPAD
jgi:ABC-type sugar transport system permease subunit